MTVRTQVPKQNFPNIITVRHAVITNLIKLTDQILNTFFMY